MPATNTPGSCQVPGLRYIEPLNPHPDDIDIRHIGLGLALNNRWSGFTHDVFAFLAYDRVIPIPFSVGQHSCHVHDIVMGIMPEAAPYALMHDASEAYIVDIPRPIKPSLTNYYEIEERVMSVILRKFGILVSPEIIAVVKDIDNKMIFWERDYFMGVPTEPYSHEDQHPGNDIHDVIPDFEPWSPQRSYDEFMQRFNRHNLLNLAKAA